MSVWVTGILGIRSVMAVRALRADSGMRGPEALLLGDVVGDIQRSSEIENNVFANAGLPLA